jgi:RNA polymerase sigma factor (TIGR02999 family)
MTTPAPAEVTQLLRAWSEGDRAALDRLMPLVYDELRELAKRYMSRERPDHLLQTTALVNEAYLRLIDVHAVQWQNRAHFFALSAQLMRRVLVDFARARNFAKRGGAALHVTLSEAAELPQEQNMDLVALDEVLTRLAALDERASRVVELRFFAGLSVAETAAVLQVSPETVLRDWKFAKSWVLHELKGKKRDEA